MMREVLPTGQLEEETKELLDEYNELYDWEYNDMVDFIKEHGEKILESIMKHITDLLMIMDNL